MAAEDKNPQAPETEAQAPEKKDGNAIHKLYDKLPFTFRQVDIFVKVMIGLLVVLVIFGIVKGTR